MSHWQNVIKKVSQYNREHQLIQPGDKILLGVSGGQDSVLLCAVMQELAQALELNLHLAHMNYQKRGADSAADANLVATLAEQAKFPYYEKTVMPPAENEALNFQEWAREQRYEFFAKLCQEHQLDKIAVAHHLTDQIETFFLRMLRGSGLTGLSSIRPKQSYFKQIIVRPLLPLTRLEIEAASKELQLEYHHDHSNDQPTFRRNQIRLNILPQLSDIQANYERALGNSLHLMQAEDQYLDTVAKNHLYELLMETQDSSNSHYQLDRKAMQSLTKVIRLRVFRLLIGELTGGVQSITFHHVNKMDELLCGKSLRAQYDLPNQLLYEQGPTTVIISLKPSLEKL